MNTEKNLLPLKTAKVRISRARKARARLRRVNRMRSQLTSRVK